jgi:hypothetical protein
MLSCDNFLDKECVPRCSLYLHFVCQAAWVAMVRFFWR